MIFFIRHGDIEHTVRVETRNGQLVVRYGDEAESVADLNFFGNDCTFIQDGKVFFANVVGDKTDFTVWRPAGNLHFGVESEYKRIVNMLRGQSLDNENNIYAKMPGKIVKILAKAGSTVERGSPLMVMEAMKMENEIRATRPATVTNICVKEGQAVETGALLMELELSSDLH
jgi:biotin carboxyl carrier protein